MFKMRLLLIQICNLLFSATATMEWNFAGVNVALGKPTAHSPGTYIHQSPELAVDGNTNLSHIICSHTSGEFNTTASWTVDLEGLFMLKGIRLYSRDDCCLERHKDFRIIGLPSRSILYDDSTANPPLYLNKVIDVAVDSPQQFSSVSVEVPPHTGSMDDGKSYLQLCEVQIYSENDDCSLPSSGLLVASVRQGTGYWNADKSLVSSGSVMDFSCSGYYTLVGNISVTCKKGGQYNSTTPTCIEIRCNKPPIVMDGHYIHSVNASYTVGATVIWECDQGYTTEQNRSIQCLSSATWSQDQLICSQIKCSYPELFSNGILEFPNNVDFTSGTASTGTILNLSCDKGFMANSETISCADDGQWNVLPNCLPVLCSRLEKPTGGYYTFKLNGRAQHSERDTFEYGTVAIVVCNETMFRPTQESVALRTCGQDAHWSGNDNFCELDGCPVVDESTHLAWAMREETGISARGRVSTWTVVDFSCDDGYSLVGAPSIVCLPTGSYNTLSPLCTVLEMCPVVGESTHLSWTMRNQTGISVRGLVSTWTVVDFSCENDYRLIGASSIVCLPTRSYNTLPPWCTSSELEKQSSLNTTGIAGGASVGGIVVGAIVAVVVMLLVRKRRPPPKQTSPPSMYMSRNPALTDSDHVYSDLGQT